MKRPTAKQLRILRSLDNGYHKNAYRSFYIHGGPYVTQREIDTLAARGWISRQHCAALANVWRTTEAGRAVLVQS